MVMILCSALFVCLLLKPPFAQPYGNEEDNSFNFPRNDFVVYLNVFWKKLGIKRALNRFGKFIKKSVRDAHAFSAYDFERCIEKVKNYPSFWNIIEFFRKTTWPGIVHTCTQVIHFFSQVQKFMLRFLKSKCDEFIGKDTPLHPWNIIKQQDQTQVSFLVFVYAFAISLAMFKILSWWNFSVYLAFGFLAYYIGGSYSLFKMLLTCSAFIWFLVDVVLENPLQVAVVIIIVFVISLAKTLLGEHSPYTRQYSGNIPDREEYNVLAERVNSMEHKTNLLNSKVDKLSRSVERIVSDDGGD